MPNSGARRVVTFSKGGTRVERIFYEADVEMPILSVAELSDEGERGSEVRFRRRDGYIEDSHTGRKCFFVKLKGVFVVKLYVPKDQAHNAFLNRVLPGRLDAESTTRKPDLLFPYSGVAN